MHKFYVYTITIVLICLLMFQYSYATSDSVVISTVQLGDTLSATNEVIEIYNNSDNQIEITDWCLYYASSSSIENGNKLSCFNPETEAVHIFLPAYSSVLLVSNQLKLSNPDIVSDYSFSATLSGSSGYLRLIDNGGFAIDKIGWGVKAILAEGSLPTAVPPVGDILKRKAAQDNLLQDTDNNLDDFEIIDSPDYYNYGFIYELYDLCLNIEDLQLDLPDGYILSDDGSCILPPVDICSNLDGLQEILPENYWQDENNECHPDVCINLDGIQQLVPDDYFSDSDECYLDLLTIKINELLPNVIGSDIGNEFIEIYNSNNVDIDLSNYLLNIGGINYGFLNDSVIKTNDYFIVTNKDIKYSLNNTKGAVRIMSIDDRIIDEVMYENTVIGNSWSLIDNLWQYTNQLTPGSFNKVSIKDDVDEIELTVSQTPSCADNQYRNPETGRCKLISSKTSVLAPCKDGQYRSEETNRCRNIASDVVSLVPCAEGQERNPETNRCRNIITTDVLGVNRLTPCKEGQERNPETNRCRNIISDVIPKVDYAPIYGTIPVENNIFTFSLYGVGLAAVIYGLWEWRYEIIGQTRRASLYLKSRK